jgi:hypothetical protein
MKELMTSFNICTQFHSDNHLATFNTSWVNDLLLIHLKYDILGPDYFIQILFAGIFMPSKRRNPASPHLYIKMTYHTNRLNRSVTVCVFLLRQRTTSFLI